LTFDASKLILGGVKTKLGTLWS